MERMSHLELNELKLKVKEVYHRKFLIKQFGSTFTLYFMTCTRLDGVFSILKDLGVGDSPLYFIKSKYGTRIDINMLDRK